MQLLPSDSGAVGGGAWALLTDASSGQATLIGGRVEVHIPLLVKHRLYQALGFLPRLWTRSAATGDWQMVALSTGPSNTVSVRQLSQDSIAAGMLGPATIDAHATDSTQAVLWQPSGPGTWSLVTLAPVPSGAEAINSAGTLVVGAAGGVAAYWQRNANGTWSGPVSLPGACTDARGVDDSGRIAADGCTTFKEPVTVFAPPYSTSSIIHLGGLGPNSGVGTIQGMSPSGQWVVGSLGGTGSAGGVYWKLF
jgi:hypothetical protein